MAYSVKCCTNRDEMGWKQFFPGMVRDGMIALMGMGWDGMGPLSMGGYRMGALWGRKFCGIGKGKQSTENQEFHVQLLAVVLVSHMWGGQSFTASAYIRQLHWLCVSKIRQMTKHGVQLPISLMTTLSHPRQMLDAHFTS